VIEAGAGAKAGFSDADYKAAGVEVVQTATALWKAADVVARAQATPASRTRLFFKDNTRMFYGDAKDSVSKLTPLIS